MAKDVNAWFGCESRGLGVSPQFLSSAIMIPFHKLALFERGLLKDPRLRPITIGALLCRFSVRTVMRMKRKGIADRMLRDNQFSYGVWVYVRPRV